jgi:hypothetical protein
VPPAVSRTLMKKRKQDQHEVDTEYQKNVAKLYALMAKGKNWQRISCAPQGTMLSRGAIHEKILEALQ